MAQERRDRLRQALIEAAERIIDERGLAALRARDLAEAAGCAVGAIYTAFPDLDSLILEVNRRTLIRFEEGIKSDADDVAPGEALVQLAMDYLAFARMMLQRGEYRGQRLISVDSVTRMTTVPGSRRRMTTSST